MNKVSINVQIVYRNYKRLHPLYNSLITDPPSGVNYIIPEPSSNSIKRFGFKFYRRFKKYSLISDLINRSQRIFFPTKPSETADIIEYIQLIPAEIPEKDYIIDVEHAAGLYNFTKPTPKSKGKIVRFLSNEKCKGIICTSNMAIKTFQKYFTKEELEGFKDKIILNYPALQYINDAKKDHTYLKENGRFKILFVGNDVYRKGLHELLEAFNELNNDNMELHIISNADPELKTRYSEKNIFYYTPNFTHKEVINKFFSPADIFVMPTHFDTFGMVLLDSLSAGTPAIATKQFAIPEIIHDGENGILIDSDTLYLNDKDEVTTKHYGNVFPKTPEKKMVDQIAGSIEKLYSDPQLLKSMELNTKNDFLEGGKFSVSSRNEKLMEIYNKALK